MPDTAVILGSGFGQFVGNSAGQAVTSAYGEPSAPVHEVVLNGTAVLTLARHGDEHTIPPHRINYRANIDVLRSLGVRSIVALNTVGVIGDIRDGGQIGVPDQLLDYTWGREHTFHTGLEAGVEHIEFTEPFPLRLRKRLLAAAERAGVDCYDGGVYAATQGPRLETAAEVDRLEGDGANYIGMTGMPEAVLAAEAGIDYACLALVVNKAAGRGDKPIHADVESCTEAVRAQAICILDAFFAAEDGA